MNIIDKQWYKDIKVAAQETASDVVNLIVKSEYDLKNIEEFAERHGFHDAIGFAFGDTDEGEFDWNCNLACLWICGLRPVKLETDAGSVLFFKPTGVYSPSMDFKEAYMEASMALQETIFGDVKPCQRSFPTIMSRLVATHRVWRDKSAAEYKFLLEFAVTPNQPLV